MIRAAAPGRGPARRAPRAPHRTDREGLRGPAGPRQRGEPGGRAARAPPVGPGLPAAHPARERAGEQPGGDGRLERESRRRARPARQDGHVARARRPAAGPRRLGHHRGQHRPAADLPGVRVSRLLLANELTDAAGIAWLAAELAADPGFEAYCYVDSLDGVAILDHTLREHPAGRPLPVLVEIGHPGAPAAGPTRRRSPWRSGRHRHAHRGGRGRVRGRHPRHGAGRARPRLPGLADALADGGGPRIVTAGGIAYFNVVAAN